MNGRGWIYLGAWAGMALAYGIGKALLPTAPLGIAFAVICGATGLGAILGQIARKVQR